MSYENNQPTIAYTFYGYKAEILLSENLNSYQISCNNDNLNYWEKIAEMCSLIQQKFSQMTLTTVPLFSETFDKFQTLLIDFFPEIGEEKILPLFFEVIGLQNLGPFLLDRFIEEIFLRPKTKGIEVLHSKYGKCQTKVYLSDSELNNFISRVAIENNFPISTANPTLKGQLKTHFFHLRVTIDLFPLSIDGTTFNIRYLRKKGFSLSDLVDLGALTEQAAKFLQMALNNGSNITIIGTPSSGKTTLQNALLEEFPLFKRIISIEDAIESFPENPAHMIRYKVDSFEKFKKKTSKSIEITKLLHRSPDYLNLGEISTKDHAKAWFHALSAGINSIQTIHGNSIESLILRMETIFQIPKVLFATSVPHILVEMKIDWKEGRKERRIFKISEIKFNEKSLVREDFWIQILFQYDKEKNRLVRIIDQKKKIDGKKQGSYKRS